VFRLEEGILSGWSMGGETPPGWVIGSMVLGEDDVYEARPRLAIRVVCGGGGKLHGLMKPLDGDG